MPCGPAWSARAAPALNPALTWTPCSIIKALIFQEVSDSDWESHERCCGTQTFSSSTKASARWMCRSIVAVSVILAFLSGMEIRRRVALNLVIIAATVGITYLIGTITKAVWGIAV